ncbi:MAG: hypothetical protein WC076_10695 [Terrimicrobiaceae bacterium]
MTNNLFLITGMAGILSVVGCVSHGPREVPAPSFTKSVGVFDFSHSLDRNDDGVISNDEWVAAGGSEGRIRPSPRSPEENPHLKIRPNHPLSDLVARLADLGTEEPMTPQEFRSPPGARLANLRF